MSSSHGSGAVEGVDVPLPDSPDGSLANAMSAAPVMPIESGPSNRIEYSIANSVSLVDNEAGGPTPSSSAPLQSPTRKTQTTTETKPMSPEKAALAAMFDSIKMPLPTSPPKSPRKPSGSSALLSPPKQVTREAAPAALSLFRKSSSPSISPRKVASSDSAASRHFSRDSPMRRPILLSSSSPSSGLRVSEEETKNASTPLSPAGPSSAAGSKPPRMRPSMLASSSSPSARLSDLSLTLDTTGTQELLFNQDASFLLATGNTAADVTIDDSFDMSHGKTRFASAITSARRSSPAKFGTGYRAKPRCSVVPEDAVPEIQPRSPGKRSNALGLRGLGVGKVVKNAAGDDTIDLNLTGSFIGNMSVAGGNIMDESGEASMLFGNNSFSISGVQNKESEKLMRKKESVGRKGNNDEDEDEDEEEEDYERDTKNVQKWAAEAARKAQLGRQAVEKTPSRPLVSSRVTASTVTRPSIGTSTITKPAPRIVSRPSLVTPTAGSRLIKPRTSTAATNIPAAQRSGGHAGPGSAFLSMPAIPATASASASAVPPSSSSAQHEASDPKTPVRSRRKSTFTSTRPPVSGPARRRESLAASAAATLQAHPIPNLPSLASSTPGRARTTSAPSAAAGSPIKTPTAATSRVIPKPRSSLTGRTSGFVATSRVSVSADTGTSGIGALPRPRASLTSTCLPARSVLSSSTTTATPNAHAPTVRSTSIATPTAKPAETRSSMVKATRSGGMRKSASQPYALDSVMGETPTTAAPRRTLVPRASMNRIGTTVTSSASAASGTILQLTTPRAKSGAVRAANGAVVTLDTTAKVLSVDRSVEKRGGVGAVPRPSLTARTAGAGGFGFKPRTWAVYVGSTPTLPDGEEKEN
ncbi:uncharacterized protein MEPE_01161 [Melanopsichium pennsylvanicum]|uniref:Uncharacterized protein n=2 Tax=Melanopsichium pennsylvanicum TaxID=63383 RepID=A0AAJ5C3C0_9BASI|nr:putative protein [Melanopsichium pennsylvanicum 4]SNX82455.1 uncharacterized protein MEPE_01161 [Melanopsichium pennsylvanicum]